MCREAGARVARNVRLAGPRSCSSRAGWCRTLALPKPAGGVRPIAVGELLRRLTGKCLMAVVKDQARTFVWPAQVGLAVKGGAGKAVHAVRAWTAGHADSSHQALLKLDFCNAFNCVSTEEVLKQTVVHFPALARWAAWCYRQPSCLQFGNRALESSAGVQQGDLPLLFSLALQPLAAELRSDSLDLAVHFLDDGVLALRLAQTRSSAIGLELNLDKCELVVLGGPNTKAPLVALPDQRPDGSSLSSSINNFELLGAAMGEDGYNCAHIAARASKAAGGERSLRHNDAICDLQRQLRDGEAVFAFLDDVYIVALPERTRALYDALSTALWDRARIRLHEGKTRVWNAAGEEPPAVADLGGDAHEPVWVGDWSLPPERQGLTVLGSPLGHDAFVAHHLQSKRTEHDRLLQRIPHLDDLQAAWLLLQCCAAPRANYLLRIPTATLLTGRLGATPSLSSRPARPPLPSACSERCAARASCPVPPLRSSRGSTSATAALMPRIGLRAPHPVPTTQYPANGGRSRAGSDSLPMLVTSARTRCTFLTLHPLLERCCCPKLGLSPSAPLTSRPRGMTLPCPAPCSVCSCCAACGFPSRSRRADAGSSTLLVTTALLVPPRESCLPGPCR